MDIDYTKTTTVTHNGWAFVKNARDEKFVWLQFTGVQSLYDNEGDYLFFVFEGVNPERSFKGNAIIHIDNVHDIFYLEERPVTLLAENTDITVYGFDTVQKLTSDEDYVNYDEAFKATELYAESVERDAPYDIHAKAKYPL